MRILTLPFFAVLLTVGSVLGQPPPQPPPPPHGGAGGFIQQALGLGGSYLGVGLLEIDEDRAAELGMGEAYGVEISNVAPDSPAERAGVEKGDAVLQYAGQRVTGVEHFARLVKETPVGRKIKLSMLREGSELDLQATIGERKHRPPYRSWFCDEDEPGCEFRVPGFDWGWRGFGFDLPRPHMVIRNRFLGAEVESVEGQLAEYFGVEKGLLVRSVEPNTPGERAQLKAGDIIVALAGKPVADAGDLRKAIRDANRDEAIALEVMRDRSKVTLSIEPHNHRSERKRGHRKDVRTRRNERL